jgi:putative endonuclease
MRDISSSYNKKYYIYTILSLRNYSIYTGFTTNLRQRLQNHSRGLVSASKITIPFKLIHYEYFVNLDDANERIRFLKSAQGKIFLKKILKTTFRDRRSFPYRFHS